MIDELYPGYDPLIDPNPITCWGHPTAEQMQACADRRRKSIAIYRLYGEAYYENCYRLREWLTRLMIDEAKEEFLRNNAWAHQFFSRVG